MSRERHAAINDTCSVHDRLALSGHTIKLPQASFSIGPTDLFFFFCIILIHYALTCDAKVPVRLVKHVIIL